MEPYRVFISSAMNGPAESLMAERRAAREAIDHFAPITTAWAFEGEPASTKPLLEYYLREVKNSDLFVLILGERLTKPVNEEYKTACDHQKPILVFPKTVPSRSEEVSQLLATLDAKYEQFDCADDLRGKLRRSLGTHLLGMIRGEREEQNSTGDNLGRLRRIAAEGKSVSVLPIVPVKPYNEFRIQKIDRNTITLHKSNGQDILIPSRRIEDLLDFGTGQEMATVILNGRLQWITIPGWWRFLPEKPPVPDPMGIGLGRTVARDFADFPKVRNPGYQFCWTNPQHVPNREVFFDEDGCHLTNDGQILTCARYR